MGRSSAGRGDKNAGDKHVFQHQIQHEFIRPQLAPQQHMILNQSHLGYIFAACMIDLTAFLLVTQAMSYLPN